ncbi:MAG: ankyrin repeat domain-containing protein [Simkaniaceae bacterium]|nr:ankyrin repeat domain-containing protein [Simkaniaceae bacterium]
MSVPSTAKLLLTEEPIGGFSRGRFGALPRSRARVAVTPPEKSMVSHLSEMFRPLLDAEDDEYKIRFATLMHCKISEMRVEATRSGTGTHQTPTEEIAVLTRVTPEGPGQLSLVRQTVKQEWPRPGTERITGRTPLHCLVIAGMTDVVKRLVLSGRADLNAQDDEGYTPLHYAADREETDMVALLVKEKEIKLNLKDHEGLTPLYLATLLGRIGAVMLLIGRKESKFDLRDHEGRTLFHLAVLSGRIDMVASLVEKEGVELNLKDHRGNTPFHLAVLLNQAGTVTLLSMHQKVELNAKNNEGRTPLHYAVMPRIHTHIAKTLIFHTGVNPCAWENKERFTPLHLAATGGRIDVVRWLIDRKEVDPNVGNRNGANPLHLAAAGGRADVVEFLITQKRVEVDAGDAYGNTALHVATACNHIGVMKMLIDRGGANPDAEDVMGRTALHFAAMRGYMDAVKVLIDRHVRLNPKCDGMLTPRACAHMKGHSDVATFLSARGGEVDESVDVGRLLRMRMGQSGWF